MSTRRRFVVMAFAFPAWIVMILAGGEWCLMPGGASARVVAQHEGTSTTIVSHAERSAHGGAHGRTVQLTDAERVFHAQHPTDRHAPAPHAPIQHQSHHTGDSNACTSPSACTVAVATPGWSLSAGRAHADRPLIVRADRPASIALSPELPPPRA